MGIDTYGFPTSIVTGTVQNYSYNFNPVTGNLAWRQNNKYTGLREDFQYDGLDRLTDVLVNSVTTLSMSYDGNIGGLTGKSDAGTFTYDAFEKPYAIKSIDPTTGLVPDSTQTIGYTSFNKVGSISENGYEANFIYGSDDQRSRMIVKQNGNTILTRWYPTGSYVKETSGGVTKEYTFIGGDAYTAPAIAIKQSGTTTYYSVLRDHLGSITHVVSSSGSVVAEYSYDAWGRMRNPSTWTNYEPGSEPALMIAGRGYTGHEHLPWFNTINMNGRLYDPLTGMFLSPDNYVQSAENSQSFNRYSYGLNNPLRYSDPSGMLLEPLPNPADAGYPYNPEAAAYLANCYYQFDCSYGGGVGGGTYSYNWYTGNYHDANGNYVTWSEVYYNYVVPYSSTDPKEIKEVINSIEFNSPNTVSSGGTQISCQSGSSQYANDNCGISTFEIVPNIEEAEKYIDDSCDHEKFFFITAELYAIVGPWNDATRIRCSPRQWKIFNEGTATVHGRVYSIVYLIHTQPDHPHPSPDDYEGARYLKQWGIDTFIYYGGRYWSYDQTRELGTFPLKEFLMNIAF